MGVGADVLQMSVGMPSRTPFLSQCMRTNISMSAHVGLSPQNHPEVLPSSFFSRFAATLQIGGAITQSITLLTNHRTRRSINQSWNQPTSNDASMNESSTATRGAAVEPRPCVVACANTRATFLSAEC